MMRWLTPALLVAIVALLGAQLVRPARTNPATDPRRTIQAQFASHTTANAAIARACRDCHSHETAWPWYSQVAPASWLLVSHVNDGRKAVNFSEWAGYAPDRQAKLLREVCEAVTEGEMPIFGYTAIHRTARLTLADVNAICGMSPLSRAAN